MKAYGLYDPMFEHDSCGVGFTADILGRPSHSIVEEGITILKNLEHRGAIGGDQKTGDGAGMLTQIPHEFFGKLTGCFSAPLPHAGAYGVGMLFLPRQSERREKAKRIIEDTLRLKNAAVLGWREVPINADCLGTLARQCMPSMYQVFVTVHGLEAQALGRALYVLRKCIEKKAADAGFSMEDFYIASFSNTTIVYKGMFVAPQFASFYPDLVSPDFQSAIALVHQRYSTNTLPSWCLAQPFRFLAHNGEINTLRGNINKMNARERSLSSPLFGEDIKELFPIIMPGGSDSAMFDNVFELLSLGGRSMEHSMMMMIPEAFGAKYHISEDKRAFYEYHAAIMEPWDGPAAIAFTDGTTVGAALDRNGLRPARYVVTKNGRIVLASEIGVVDFSPEEVLEKGRLAPGKMLLVDTKRGRIVGDNEIKATVSRRKPYRRWLEKNKIELRGLFGAPGPIRVDAETLTMKQKIFGYTLEECTMIIGPMAENAQEPVGSMGNDAALAVLSRQPQLLYNYFKQSFAQVTNPPIDPYRENLVMSLMSFLGKESNLLDETELHCRQLKLSHPVLSNDDMEKLLSISDGGFKAKVVSLLFGALDGETGLASAMNGLRAQAEACVDEGYSLIVLSDRGVGRTHAAIPALLAVSAVHHHLIRAGKRHLAGLIIETGEAREVMHFATLLSFGASAVNPYLVFETLAQFKESGALEAAVSLESAIENYITAVKKGLLKVMSKMGISTIRSYKGAQVFEAVGLSDEFIGEYFPGASSRVGGIGLSEVARETLARHGAAFDPASEQSENLESGGAYHVRAFSEQHRLSPEAITLLQKAVREGDANAYKRYALKINDAAARECTLRGLFAFKKAQPVSLDSVEPVESILKRFVSSAMSFGSISKEAHETVALAMNRLGSSSNSGEGGEDEARYAPLPGGDSLKSAIKQVASARFGVTSNYLVNSRELQIKIAQGAKPGEGGQLPGSKVDETIARVRHSMPGVMLISPPPHHDIYSIEDLAQLIFDLKNANPQARVSVKLVAEAGVGTIAAGVAKGKADMVLISGHDGGTGASPLSSIKYAGIPWEIGLAETQQVLVMNGLRDRIRVQTDGQLRTGRDVVIAALLGAEEFGFGTVVLVTLGCIMMRKCHLNTCPVGITTQDPVLRKRFTGKPEYVINFMRFVAQETREIMATLGFRTVDEMVGRVDMLEVDKALGHWKARGLDFSKVLTKPSSGPLRCTTGQMHDFSKSLDPSLIERAAGALQDKKPVKLSMPIRNCNRTAGAMLSGEVSKRFGAAGLPPDTISVKFTGVAGQSFGAFLAPGITFELEGDANDYVGKGLSGGKIIIYPSKAAAFRPHFNIIAGNVNLFGATGGEVYIQGMAGERFAVRNSGASAVVEGVGDHGCEYMTGGRVVVLGRTGVNFAAGMSGGIAYVLDENQLFDTKCNLEMVDLEPVTQEEDKRLLQTLIANHARYTGSAFAGQILKDWDNMCPLFVKVMPIDYRRALERIKKEESRETENVAVTEEVFG